MNECMNDKAHNLWSDLCSCEERISVLKREISSASKSQADMANLDCCKKNLEDLQLQKETLVNLIEDAERRRLGEEIKRTQSGSLDIVWDDLDIEDVQRQVNSVFGIME